MNRPSVWPIVARGTTRLAKVSLGLGVASLVLALLSLTCRDVSSAGFLSFRVTVPYFVVMFATWLTGVGAAVLAMCAFVRLTWVPGEWRGTGHSIAGCALGIVANVIWLVGFLMAAD